MKEVEKHRINLLEALQELGHYRITTDQVFFRHDEEVRGGGFGDVLVATLWNADSPTLVAVKTLRQQGTKLQRARVAVRLAREVYIMSKLSHPHILPLIGFSLDDAMLQTAWVISPYLANGNIKEYLEENEVSKQKRIELALDTGRGLYYLHSQNPPICHADIKPGNVLISDDIRGVLCDFGISRVVSETQGFTTSKTIKGSTIYMSPDLFISDNPVHTLKSDVWAWGCLVLEITTGRLPYQGSNSPIVALAKIARGVSPAPGDYVKKEIPSLAPLLEMCWRYSDVLRPDIGLCVAILASSQPKKEQSLASAVQNLPATTTSIENSGKEACTINTNISSAAPEQPACFEGISAMDSFPEAGKRNNISELIGLNPPQAQVWYEHVYFEPSKTRSHAHTIPSPDSSLSLPSPPSQNPSFESLLDLSASAGVPPVPSRLPTAADVENLALEISRSTATVLKSGASRTSIASGRSTGKSRLSMTEKLVARLPPSPSMAPPAPLVEGVTVKKYQELGRRTSMEEDGARASSSRPMPVAFGVSSAGVSIVMNGSIKRRQAPPSPPMLCSDYRPDPSKDVRPKPPPTLSQQHPRAAAVLSSQPALPSRKGWMGSLLPSGNSTMNLPPPVVHAVPGAHQSPATLPSPASRANMSSSSLAPSTMESASRSGLITRENSPVKVGPNGTIQAAASRTSLAHAPHSGMQWVSSEDKSAPRVNDLGVMPPPPSAQWSTSEEVPARAVPAPKPPVVKGFISSAQAFNADPGPSQPRRKMDTNWRSYVMSDSTTASSGSGSMSIVKSAGTLSSAESTFKWFSNSGVRSVSTSATSASAMSRWGERPGSGTDGPSWRQQGPPVTDVDSGFVGQGPLRPRKTPAQKSNFKRMDGIPWELDELPRVHQPRVKGVLPDTVPARKQQSIRGHRSSPPLDPISEKNNSTSQSPPPSPDAYRSRESATSTTDLEPALDAASTTSANPRSSPDLKKQGSQKSQSHAFQKFSLFRARQGD